MQPIDVGDLQLSEQHDTRQTALFHAIREKIVQDLLWVKGSKLPSNAQVGCWVIGEGRSRDDLRVWAVSHGGLSRKSHRGSGFYVSVEQPEHFLNSSQPNLAQSWSVTARASVAPRTIATTHDINSGFLPPGADLNAFLCEMAKATAKHDIPTRQNIAGNQDVKGSVALRDALSGYLASSRSVRCHADRDYYRRGRNKRFHWFDGYVDDGGWTIDGKNTGIDKSIKSLIC